MLTPSARHLPTSPAAYAARRAPTVPAQRTKQLGGAGCLGTKLRKASEVHVVYGTRREGHTHIIHASILQRAVTCVVKLSVGFMFPGTLPTLRGCWWTSSWTTTAEISMCRIRFAAAKHLAFCNAVLASVHSLGMLNLNWKSSSANCWINMMSRAPRPKARVSAPPDDVAGVPG